MRGFGVGRGAHRLISVLPRDDLVAIAELRSGLRRFLSVTDEVTRRHRLTPRRYDLLAMLHGAESGSCTASELAERLRLSRNAITELITRAADAGLVRREPDTRDGRVKLIVPTREGSTRYLAAAGALAAERQRLFELLEHVRAKAHLLAVGSGSEESRRPARSPTNVRAADRAVPAPPRAPRAPRRTRP